MFKLSNSSPKFLNQCQSQLIYQILSKIEEKLQSLVTKISKHSDKKQDSQIQTRDDVETVFHQNKYPNINLNEKSSQILYQVEVLQILLAEKSIPEYLHISKLRDFPIKNSIESNEGRINIDSYISNSFSGKQKQKIQALREILLTLCTDSELEQKSKTFLKNQIEDFFSKKQLIGHISIDESKQTTQHYLQKFITQIGQLRQQIETLSEQNQSLMKQKAQLLQRLLKKQDETNFQNPELNLYKNIKQVQKNSSNEVCQSCFKYCEDNKYLVIRFKKVEQLIYKKQNTIKQMNEQFSKQIQKYNRVFERLQDENNDLRRYIQDDLGLMIQNLQNQIEYLKSSNRQVYQRRKPINYVQHENQYNFVNSKFNTPFSNIPTQQYINSNIFSDCSIRNKRNPNLRNNNNRLKIPQRSKSKNSQYSRPHSYKSHSPNSQIKKTIQKKYIPAKYQIPYFNRYQRQ